MAKKSKTNGAAETHGTREGDIEERKVSRDLPVTIDEGEVADNGKKLAALHAEIEAIALEKKAACSDANARLKDLRKQSHDLAESIRNGTEIRAVACIETLDWRVGTKTVKRTDTGEVVDEAAISAEERQAELDIPAFDAEPPKGVDAVL